MSKYLYVGALVIAVAFIVVYMSYRTQPSSTPPVSQTQPTAEFGDVSLRIELATTTMARERGLGGRTSIPSNYGMLFVFPSDYKYGFWMKDTLVPLDIFWLDDKGHVVSIAMEVATSSYPHVFYPSVPARYVLETASGFAREHNITINTPLVLPSGLDVLK